MKQPYFNRIIFGIIGLLILFVLYLQYAIIENTEKIKKDEIQKSEKYAQKIVQYLRAKTGGHIESALTNNPKLRDQLNDVLQAFLTENYQYIFVLKKDTKGHYRFLLDGSKEEAVEYQTIFFPQSSAFDRVYETQKTGIAKQQESTQKIWLSLLYPIVEDKQTQALLVVDLSEEYADYLNNLNSPLKVLVSLMQIFLVVSMALLGFMAYRYYKFRQSVLNDTLTGAHTKLYLEEFFNRNRLDEYNAILIDIDEFKEINEKYGYDAGDAIIKEFVQAVLAELSLRAKLIRTGGTEFFIIVPKNEIELGIVTQKLFEILREKKYLTGNDIVSLSISMSAMVIPKGASSLQAIQRVLDEKLLEVKSRGKNNFIVLDLQSINDLRYRDIDYIKEALEEKRVCCLYQPIVCTQTKQIIKYEALVRLMDKEDSKKLIAPHHFLKVIKGTTQYIKMSKLVLEEVFSTLHAFSDIQVSINLDLDDLYSSDMMKLITKHLHKNREVANRLTFEILEYHEIQDYDKVALIFQQLKTYGSKIAIDDFGSGYANYYYLIHLDIDIIKIDGNLISQLHTSSRRTKIVLQSIQKLAKDFGYKLVAEFVCDEMIYEQIKELDIEYSQGYYLGEPKPIGAYEKFIKL